MYNMSYNQYSGAGVRSETHIGIRHQIYNEPATHTVNESTTFFKKLEKGTKIYCFYVHTHYMGNHINLVMETNRHQMFI